MGARTTPFAGWTLSEALARAADRKSWALWLREKAAWEKVHGAIKNDEIDGPATEQDSAARQSLVDRFASPKQRLWNCLANNQLVATGERAGHQITVQANDWTDLTKVRWQDSAIENAVTGERLESIRIYPIVYAPDVGKRLDGLSLGEAFFTCVGAVAKLVGIEGGVVSEVFNLESPGVEAPARRPRHDQKYHED